MTAGRALAVVLAVLAASTAGGLAGVPVAGIGGGPPVAVAHPEPGDRDGDTIGDTTDNCPDAKNGAQVDTDADRAGDACDDDDDGDGAPDASDNCRTVANPGQENADGDPYGDACPPVDSDGDGLVEYDDNCDAVANPDQVDADGDDAGDTCDADLDGDGRDNAADTCPVIYDPDQADGDGDRIGTACDPHEALAAGGRPRDRRAPRLTLTVATRQAAARAARALTVRARCSEACLLEATLQVSAAQARRLGLPARRTTLARGSWALGAAGTTFVFVRPVGARARAALRRARGRHGAVTVTAIDAAGNATRRTRTVRFV